MNKSFPYIICVDDDKINLKLLKAFLRNNYELKCVTDGQQCIDAVEQRQPDLVLLDIMMPVVDGKEVCKQLKDSAVTKNIPILVLSGRSFQEDIDGMYALGADDYITKPFSKEQLITAINRLTTE